MSIKLKFKQLLLLGIMNNLVKKYKITSIAGNQKGAAAIFLTLFILSTMFFVALTASDIIQNGIQMSISHINSTKAYYGAEAGAERILWEVRKNVHDPVDDGWTTNECVRFLGTGNINTGSPTRNCSQANTTQTLENDVVYHIRYTLNAGVVRFKSYGDYKGETRRAVDISYID